MAHRRTKPSARQLNRLLQTYSRQLQQQPGNLRARLKLAEVCRLLGRDDEAVKLYRGTAACHAIAGDLPKAIVVCQLILAIRPYHDETQRMLARIYGSKRVRDAKQSVPVRKEGKHWVAEPEASHRGGSDATPDSAQLLATMAASPAHERLLRDLRPEDRDLAHEVTGTRPSQAPSEATADTQLAQIPDDPAVPYASLQIEVQQEGHECADSEPDQAEAACAEEDLQAAFARVETQVDGLTTAQGLPQTPLFSDLNTAEFVALLDHMDARTYRAGEMVLNEGDNGDTLMIVAAGELQVMKQDSTQRQIGLAKLLPGCFFGEFGLLTDQRRYASVQSLTDSEILVLSKDVLADLEHDHPSISETLQRFYERRVVDMVLATSPLFRVITPEERARVVQSFVRERFAAGQPVVLEGSPGSTFYVLLVGQVEITRLSDKGEDVLLGVLSEGDYFGEMSLVSGEPSGATVRTTRVTEVLRLSSSSFYALAAAYPQVWLEVQREANVRDAINEHEIGERKARALLL